MGCLERQDLPVSLARRALLDQLVSLEWLDLQEP